jgi:hypothetical protein
VNIRQATTQYEAWLGRQIRLLQPDLRLKHDWMRADPFLFLRATFYRWAQVWPETCAKFSGGPRLLSVGDLHVENFGTWRDAEGRLVWGVNDYDEAHPLPYTNDLIRLATSAFLAVKELDVSPENAAAEILRGYQDAVKAGGAPYVLVDRGTPLRAMVRHRLRKPEKFWKKLRDLAPLKTRLPSTVLPAIRSILPDPKIQLRFAHRIAGLGSLGRERYTGLGAWLGGWIAREAKPWALSGCLFADGKSAGPLFIADLVRHSVHAHDPYWRINGPWIVRRLSPDCFRLELSHLPEERHELKLLYSMGWETANMHLGSGQGPALQRDLKRQPPRWLFQAATLMRDQVLADWRDWRR